MDKAKLVYAIVMKMDMDVGTFISSQISHIMQSNTFKLNFSTLIFDLCASKRVVSNTKVLESISLVINVAYLRKNC